MARNKISFVIPAYNEERILGECLKSVIAECARYAYESEIIVVNNASTDHTREVAASFPNVHIVDEPTKGIVHARAAGFRAATGSLIANIDADTRVPPGWLHTVMESFAHNEKLVALSGPYIYYDLPLMERTLVRLFYGIGYLLYRVTYTLFGVGAMLQGGNYVARKDALQSIGGFDTSIAFYGEDSDIARRLARVGIVQWTFRLPMYTSGRRLAAEGIVSAGWRYAVNHLWTTATGRPYHASYKDIRPS